MKKAVLFLTFNRLDNTQAVFEQIKLAKPPKLYLASDGPRKHVSGEKANVENVRKWILDNIDWECEVKTLFREENLGCGKAVSSGITWFFENELEGIIIEDDCVPSQSFFKFCEELLDYYRDDKRVWHISGDQFVEDFDNGASYYFAKIMHCWGWASWADRWKEYEFDLANYDPKNLKKFSDKKEVQDYWAGILDRMKDHQIDTWDYQWAFKIVEKDGFCINPSVNLVSNIGVEGSHYKSDNALLKIKLKEIEKVIHPEKIEFDFSAIDKIYKTVFGIQRRKMKLIKKEKIDDRRIITILGFIKLKYRKKKKSLYESIFYKYRAAKRFKEQIVDFGGRKMIIPDLPSFAHQVKDIFIDNSYKFIADNKSPLIYDCGANIGTSILFFKSIYPNSKIKAFEADEKIFDILKQNTSGLNNLDLFHNAVWINNEELSFNSEGADGGSLVNEFDVKQTVKAVRLKELLKEEASIDFLKIDIEGAETEVILDCKDELKKVKNLFVEYHSIIGKPQELGKILSAMTDAGFRYHIETLSHQSEPFLSINEWTNMDLQVNVFGYRK